MNTQTILSFLLGNRTAIERTASTRSALWIGMILVLMTSIPRNYDQDHISENTFMWIFGPLIFSTISGTWMFIIAYQWATAAGRKHASEPDIGERHEWRSFMGMFWMTAPIAWIYALPVERWLEPLPAAKANLALLAIVASWRVLLLTRCIQVVCKLPYAKALVWVVAAASVEVLVVGMFGGVMSQAVLASMGGMRNSPAEELIIRAVSNSMGAALWVGPIALIAGLIWNRKGTAQSLPVRGIGAIPWTPLFICTVIWLLIAASPQQQLSIVARYEAKLLQREYRAAVEVLNRHQPGDLPASRELEPKLYERRVFYRLPELISVLQPGDEKWVRDHFINKFAEMTKHYRSRWISDSEWNSMGEPDRQTQVQDHWRRYGPDAKALVGLLEGLRRTPEGRSWMLCNHRLLTIWENEAEAELLESSNKHAGQREDDAHWKEVARHIREFRRNPIPEKESK